MAAHGVDWTSIIVAGIAAFGAVTSACVSVLIFLLVRTPTNGSIGKTVAETREHAEQAHEIAAETLQIVNHE